MSSDLSEMLIESLLLVCRRLLHTWPNPSLLTLSGCKNSASNLKEQRKSSQDQAAKEKRQERLNLIDTETTDRIIAAQRKRFADAEQARTSQLQEHQRMQAASIRVHQELTSPELRSASVSPAQLRSPTTSTPAYDYHMSAPAPTRLTAVSQVSPAPFLAPALPWQLSGLFQPPTAPFSAYGPFGGNLPLFKNHMAPLRPGTRRPTGQVQPEHIQAILQQMDMTQRMLWSMMAMMGIHFPQ